MKPLHSCLAALTALAAWTLAAQESPPGYRDTPLLSGSTWHVHDPERPRPPVVTPGEAGVCGAPPSDAIVLFDGRDLAHWRNGDQPARWRLVEGAMEVDGSGSIESVERFGDVQLHVEWRSPAAITGSSQGRGNSGVFFMGRYEVQVLDSYDNPSYADGQAAALYGQEPPLVNACRKPGEWQSFDIVFRAPRWSGATLSAPARVTVFHNGVLVHDAEPLLGATAHRALAQYEPHAAELPIGLQDHGNPVRFRNIWARRL